MKSLIFLCFATLIVILNIITINISPIINGLVGSNIHYYNGVVNSLNWFEENCQIYEDQYKLDKEKDFLDIQTLTLTSIEDKEKYLNLLKEGKKTCKRRKTMAGLEYATFNINIIFGFTCTLLGLFNYLKNENSFGQIIGLIGLGSGVISFVLTLIYIIYSGNIFTQDVIDKNYFDLTYRYSDSYVRLDSDGAFLKWDESKKGYVCIFYDKDNEDSIYRKYSNYNNKYLNYNKDVVYAYEEKNYKYQVDYGCIDTSFIDNNYIYSLWENCKKLDEGKQILFLSSLTYTNVKRKYYDSSTNPPTEKGECDKIYAIDINNDNTKKNLYDHWVATIVLGCFILVLNVGLSIFGFLLYKGTNDKK